MSDLGLAAPQTANRSLLRLHLLLVGALCAVTVLALAAGKGDLSDARLRDALLVLRGGRLAAAMLAGAALSVGGVLAQGIFRNPLASPSVIGTTAGAGFGGRVAILFTQLIAGTAVGHYVSPALILPLGSVAGALLALALLMMVGRYQSDRVVLLLTGFLLSSLFLSLGGLVTSIAQERWELARAMISFALGDVSDAGTRQVALAAPMVIAGTLAAWSWGRSLDVLLSGEDEAASLGVDVQRTRRWCVVWIAILTAAAVSLGGSVSFVGLVVPHALRYFTGAAHRRLVFAAALGGAAFLASCDVVARCIPSRSELPLGVVTGIVGAPCFLWLLLRERQVGAYGR